MSQLTVTFNPAQVTVNAKPPVLSAGTGNPLVREYIDYPAYEGPTEVTPTEEQQTLETTDLRLTEDITVDAIPGDYIGSEVPRVTHPLPSIRLTSAAGTVTAEHTQETGYVTGGTNGATLQLTVKAGETITPTESEQTAVPQYRWTTGDVKVAAIPSDYVGSSIPHEHSTDLTASGATVTAPAGYYEEAVSKSVQSGSVSVPATSITANPSLSITQNTGRVEASVSKTQSVSPTVSEGYVSSGTSGTMTVSGSNHYDLPTQAAATITPTESAQTAVPAHKWTTGEVSVAAIPSSYVGSGVTRNDSTDLSVSGATVTVPAGYYENAASATVQSATWKSASTIGVVPSISVDANGLITATASGWTSCKPLSASGYADADTSANIQLSGAKTSQLDTIAATTYTPNKVSTQEIPAGKYTTGIQTIGKIPDEYIVPSGTKSITSNGTSIDVTSYASVDVAVPSQAAKNAQVVQGTTRTNSSTLTAIGAELTVSKTGTYDIYYSCLRTNTSSSYTWGTQLYVGGSAYGSENTSWTNNQQNNHLTNVSLTSGQKLRVYGRETRGTSYYVCAPMLAIVEV